MYPYKTVLNNPSYLMEARNFTSDALLNENLLEWLETNVGKGKKLLIPREFKIECFGEPYLKYYNGYWILSLDFETWLNKHTPNYSYAIVPDGFAPDGDLIAVMIDFENKDDALMCKMVWG